MTNYFYSFNSGLFSSSKNDYQLFEKLSRNAGSAHSTSVFKAKFLPLNIPCVLRQTNLVDCIEQREMFENESEINQLVDHPNLMKIVHYFMHTDEILYSVMPLSPFQSLDELAKPYGIHETVIGFVMVDILNAVDYLHRNNIIHRAIKGSHILMYGSFQTELRFVLIGLKYCYIVEASKESEMQVFDYPKCTSQLLNSLAPEVLEQNILGYNFKTDIYSLGIVCCELANGIIPFDNMEPDEILFCKIIGDIPKPIDSTSAEMQLFQEYLEVMEISFKNRYSVYLKRKFSEQFHSFVSEKCLNQEPTRRLTADELLEHEFLQPIKKHLNAKEKLLSKQFPQLLGHFLLSQLKSGKAMVTKAVAKQ